MAVPSQPPTVDARARIAGLDGLRALAVIGVLLYHGEVSWAQGGFIGVDIFFVLSGYLVTSIVVAGFHKRGNLGLRHFWGARLRRLAPAQLSMIVAVTVVVALLHRDELATLRGQVLAALTGTTNWYLLATEGSYFEQLGRPPLLRHLWSLAVELQFYLVFPPLLVFALRRWGHRMDRILQVLLGLVVASTIYLAVLFDPNGDPTRAYFDTFARLAAPLLGAALALVWQPKSLLRGPARQLGRASSLAGGVSLVLLLWMMHAAGDRSAFMYRGGFLLAALLSTVVVAGLTHPAGGLGGRWALGHPLLVGIGWRSYGLYLWHWPIFMLLRPRIDVSWSWATTFWVRILLTVVLTEVCYRLVERPWHLRAPDASLAGIRRRLFQPSGVATAPRLAALGGTFLVATTVIVLALPHSGGDEIEDSLTAGRAAIEQASGAPGSDDRATSTRGEQGEVVDGTTSTTVAADPTTRTVTLVGDSVMVGAAPDLVAEFGDRANVNAEVSRQAESLGPIIRQLGVEGRLGEVVVVQVGINGTVTEDDLRAIEEAAGGRPLYVLNARVPRSWEQSNNALVKRLVPKLTKGEVVDWYATSNGKLGWYLDDGIHLTAEGRAGYADLIRRAVDRG